MASIFLIISIGIGIIAIGHLALQYVISFKRLYQESKSAKHSQAQSLAVSADVEFDGPAEIEVTWDEIGNEPMLGDMSDQGAADIALKIQDLKEFEDEATTTSRKMYYRDKIRKEAERLAEITLLQIAPPPDTPKPTWAKENVITYAEIKARKKKDN